MIDDAGTRVGSGSALASPFVRIQMPSGRGTMSMIRWVNVARSAPTWSDTTSPLARSVGWTGATPIADPSPIAGAIEPPPMMIVWRPVNGTILPRISPNRTTTIRPISVASTIRRRAVIVPARIPILYSSRGGRPGGAGAVVGPADFDPLPTLGGWRAAGPTSIVGGGGTGLRPTRVGEPQPVVQPGDSGLWVVGGLLGVEGERRRGAHGLHGVARRERQADPHAENLAGTGGQVAVARLGTLGIAAEAGPVEGRRCEHARPVEQDAAVADAAVRALDG